MSHTVYRRGEARDLLGASRAHAEAFNALNRRHGYPDQRYATSEVNPYFVFALDEPATAFWVAETAGDISGVGIASVYGGVWFLSHLFVHPAWQGRGIGRGLLERTLADETLATAENHVLVTMAYNPVSLALYSQVRMRPRMLLYSLQRAARTRDPTETCGDRGLRGAELGEQEMIDDLTDLDRRTLGWTRAWHHRYFLSQENARCLVRYRSDRLESYAYVWRDGRIGPAAGRSPKALEAIFDGGLNKVDRRASGPARTFVVADDLQSLDLARTRGMRIVLPFVLFSEKPVGRVRDYLPHSPGLM